MTRTRDEAQVAEAKRLDSLGLSSPAIAAQLGVSARQVQRWLGGAHRPGPRRRDDVRDERVLELRDRDGLSFAEIGRRVHMSTTGARMRYYALTGRPRPERTATPGRS
jgi:transposase